MTRKATMNVRVYQRPPGATDGRQTHRQAQRFLQLGEGAIGLRLNQRRECVDVGFESVTRAVSLLRSTRSRRSIE